MYGEHLCRLHALGVGWVSITQVPGHYGDSGIRTGNVHRTCRALSVQAAVTRWSPDGEQGLVSAQVIPPTSGGGWVWDTHRAASRRCSSGSLCRAVAPVGGRSPGRSQGGATC